MAVSAVMGGLDVLVDRFVPSRKLRTAYPSLAVWTVSETLDTVPYYSYS